MTPRAGQDWPDGSASALGGLLVPELRSVLTVLASGPVSVLAESGSGVSTACRTRSLAV